MLFGGPVAVVVLLTAVVVLLTAVMALLAAVVVLLTWFDRPCRTGGEGNCQRSKRGKGICVHICCCL